MNIEIALSFKQLVIVAIVLGLCSGFADALFDWLFTKLKR